MAFLLKELLLLTCLVSAVTLPWNKPFVEVVSYPAQDDPPKHVEDYPEPPAKSGEAVDDSPDEVPPSRVVEPFPELPKEETDQNDPNERTQPKSEDDFEERRDEVYNAYFADAKDERMKRGAVPNGYRWPSKPDSSGKKIVRIPYKIEGISNAAVRWLKSAFSFFKKNTCIRFEPRAESEKGDFVRFINGAGCSSDKGYRKGTKDGQFVILGAGCEYRGRIMHEVNHLLGFYHEQTRPDRDQFITVNQGNIRSGFEDQFPKITQNNLGFPYDRQSVMQYSKNTFSKSPSLNTMESKDPAKPLGNMVNMDAMDIMKVNKFYGCAEANIKFIDHKVELITGNGWGDGTDGDVFVKLIGSKKTSKYQEVTAGGLIQNENEGGAHETHPVPFEDVGTVNKVVVALMKPGNVPPVKRSIKPQRKRGLFNGWTLENLKLDGTTYTGADFKEGESKELSKS